MKDTKAELQAEAEAAGVIFGTGDIHFGKWCSEGKRSFASVRAAKAAHTKFDKEECGDDPEFFIFVSITCELEDGSGRCLETWAQIHKAA